MKYIACTELTESVDDLYECVTITLQNDKGMNILVSCVYRAPGTSIDLFNEHIEALLHKINFNKIYYIRDILGDININLINCETHSPSKSFG